MTETSGDETEHESGGLPMKDTTRGDGRALLEVIASSVDDAIAAAAGGADRLEIVSRLDLGGLTPPIPLVREILQAVRIPIRVMLRESETFDRGPEAEQAELRRAAEELDQLPLDGVVLGFLKDGAIDEDYLGEVLSLVPSKAVTFHRAIEQVASLERSLAVLKRHPMIDRILTSGGSGTLEARIANLNFVAALAKPDITILVGGGVDVGSLERIWSETSITEFHVGRAVRVPETTDGRVSAERVREMLRAMERSDK